jgi:threonine aldolase
VLLHPKLAESFLFTRKQAMQLFSKSRFIAAQYVGYFKDQLWKELATHANQMAAYLASSVKEIPQVSITHPVESNAVFATIPPDVCEKLMKRHLFYIWDQDICQVRWMCSFSTTKEDIDLFVSDLKTLLGQ